MISLIKNELTKIFKKKGIYITILIVLAFAILTNCISKYFGSSNTYNAYYDEEYINSIKSQLSELNPDKTEDVQMYIDLKTLVDTHDIANKFELGSWQASIVQSTLSEYINEKNMYLYGVEKDENKANETQEKIDELLEKLENDDWKYFAELDLQEATQTLDNLEKQKEQTQNKQQLIDINYQIEQAKIEKEVAQYRVDKNIKYGNDYLNIALSQYETASQSLLRVDKDVEKMEYSEKRDYNDNLSDKAISQYIIENNINNYRGEVRGVLVDFFSQYGLFVIVIIVMIAGTIVSEEFNKGTIKLLLVKPYTRVKLLLSKYITTLIMIVFAIIIVVLIELLVGGVIFGLDSLETPVLQYNFNTNQVEEINIFAYLGIQAMAQLPMLILLATLAFALSTIFTNGAVAITIALLGYMSPSIINALVLQYDVQFMKYFVTMNWDLSQYLYGNLPSMEGMTLGFSVIMCLIYLFVMLIPTFIIFKKKNIKNI